MNFSNSISKAVLYTSVLILPAAYGQNDNATQVKSSHQPLVEKAVDDNVTTREDTPIDIDVLANDTFKPGFTFDSAGEPDHGIVTLQSNNKITYTPDDDFHGNDSFEYKINSHGTIYSASVYVTITKVADIVEDRLVTKMGVPLTIDLLNNTTKNASADNFENSAASISSFTQAEHGTVTRKSTKVLVYTPEAKYKGNDQFTYTVTSNGVKETATVSIKVQ